MNKKLLLSKLDAAKRDISAAETDLEKALRDLQVAPRAEKTTISKVLEDAFSKVKEARTYLTDLETLVLSDKD